MLVFLIFYVVLIGLGVCLVFITGNSALMWLLIVAITFLLISIIEDQIR